ncbi:TetM/TetW/TetO/TetS family tetracycline resistance ribosomal protection protein [Cytobacillus solani]|uniref:GTP-binding protein n=1 Tax=Cytobacillus solani TaxID=1637975 RepID=UPI0006ABB199|nr:TetM/TetW/TetO/TetS family tetracycline resistance ribosomal protection protein [Cytobacillus solani]KOP82503.1 elongation factor G [Bacillus sp. FJAT-21945]USK52738.1 TetM/TetW/TetO/TetS family tetracycline resistance ribosomal protection protein [Cytobacillus solani]
MNKTIGILAHVDAGKTTFSEQLLYHTKSIKQRGRVDHKDAFLDSHEIERQRGITVFADQAMFSYRNSNYYLIDTPGHVDFSTEMERAIQVMDYAIIIISAVEGIEGHTETVWALLRKYQVPTFFFINKTDRVGADVEAVLEEIRLNLTKDIFEITDSFNDGEMDEKFIEFVAERNENLLELYMETGYQKDIWLKTLQKMIYQNQAFVCSSGSALQDIGIEQFLAAIDQLTVTNYRTEQAFSGRVYKIRHDENGARISFIKALSGGLKVRDEVRYWNGQNEISEKITQIRVYGGNKYNKVDHVKAGELFAVTGLSMTTVGRCMGEKTETVDFEMMPALKSKVLFEPSVNIKEALRFFKILDAEDPSLNVIWEENLQQIHIHVMGTIQLEVLEQVVLERFQLNISFEEPEILYRETIVSTVIGYGHFEPLGHYAEVHLKLEPGERNSGITFCNACHADDLTIGNQNLIEQHLFEREHNGLLTGSPLTDVKVTLLTGLAHNKHTSGGDFREATFRALRHGLEKASNNLLEPIYEFKIKVAIDQMGRVLADIQTAFGKFNPPITEGNKAILTGTVPVATFMTYSTQLASFTQGKATINLVFAGYDRCHNEKEIIERIAYNKNADPAYTSSSIFCSKGQGYSVPWDEAEKEMHCL